VGKKRAKIQYKGQIEIADFKISCAVLDSGERILVDRSLATALGIKGGGAYWQKKKAKKGALLPEYVSAKYLAPFISDEAFTRLSEPIVYEDEDGNINEGIPATVLIDICDIWQQADKKGALENKPNAKAAANNAYIIFKGFAKVGITALVDEATGYQFDRERQELQAILKAYISEELLLWEKKFPDVFYKQIFKLNGWDFTVNGIKKRPSVIGTWTNNLIYKQLPKGVLEELRKRTPKNEKGKRKHRFHQLLSLNIGNPDLQRQLSSVITIMKLSKDWDHFLDQFNQIYGQTKLDLKFDEIDKKLNDKPVDEDLSNFNKNLNKALNHNPRKKEDKEQ